MAPEAIWISPWETTALNCYAMRNPHLLTGFCGGKAELKRTEDMKDAIETCNYQGLLAHWRAPRQQGRPQSRVRRRQREVLRNGQPGSHDGVLPWWVPVLRLDEARSAEALHAERPQGGPGAGLRLSGRQVLRAAQSRAACVAVWRQRRAVQLDVGARAVLVVVVVVVRTTSLARGMLHALVHAHLRVHVAYTGYWGL